MNYDHILTVRLGAGRIKRYHANYIIGEQTVGEHTYNVCQIIREITNDTMGPNLLLAALDHDVVEYYTGDIPYPAKIRYPALKIILNEIEETEAEALGVKYYLSPEEDAVLKFADMIECGIFGLHQVRLGNRNALDLCNKVIKILALRLDSKLLPVLPERACDLLDYLKKEVDNVTK